VGGTWEVDGLLLVAVDVPEAEDEEADESVPLAALVELPVAEELSVPVAVRLPVAVELPVVDMDPDKAEEVLSVAEEDCAEEPVARAEAL
jgi:hypothetical protein